MTLKYRHWCINKKCKSKNVIYNFTRRSDGFNYKCEKCGKLHTLKDIGKKKILTYYKPVNEDKVEKLSKLLMSNKYQSLIRKKRNLTITFE